MTITDILNNIEEEDVEFIRLQFTDIYGAIKNIAVTPGQLDRVVKGEYSIGSSALFDGIYETEEDCFLYPDLDSFAILPWRPQQGKVARLICDICNEDGEPVLFSSRAILKKVVSKAKEEGYTIMVNPECEFFLFHTDDNGNPTTLTHERAGYLDAGPADFGENARREIVLNLEEMGFDIESSHHERSCAQHEIDFTKADAMAMGDLLMTFKFAVRSIAKRFGLHATFMPKPITNMAGSGMHLNISIYKNGKNVFDSKKGEISKDALYFMGGVMAHAEGMCAITNPIVNSYKRIMSGFDAPYAINWSTKSEKVLVKHHKTFGENRVELRFPDSSSNPYLAIAVCIAAGLDGMKNKTLPGDENAKTGRHLPGNLKDAIRALQRDKLVCDVLGDEFVKVYKNLKTMEWNDYMLQVSDWEIDKYLRKV